MHFFGQNICVLYASKVLYIAAKFAKKQMISATLLNMLSKFSVKEFKEFGEFVRSPFFNKNENVISLYDYLKKHYPEFKGPKLEKEHVYSRLFKGKPYNDGFMRTVTFNLGKLAEDYLAYINFRKDDLNRGINLLKELNERKLEKVFLKYYSEIEEDINSILYHDTEYFFKKYELEEQKEIYLDWSKFKQKDFKNYSEKTISYIDDELTSFYLAKMLNHYRFILDKEQYEQIQFDSSLTDHILDYLLNRDDHFKNKIKIRLHLHEVLLIKQKKTEDYEVLKEILVTGENYLSHSDRYSLHNILQSYLIERSFNGVPGQAEERLELYRICIAQKLYAATEHIYFDDLMFGNIVITAIASKQYDWTEEFINNYSEKISPDNRDVVFGFSLARLSFARGRFEDALKHLNGIKTIRHIQYKIPVRNLTLMVTYELGMLAQAVYNIDSYRHFLNNNKDSLSLIRHERVVNFLKFFAKLVKFREKDSRNELPKLISELEETNNTIEKSWLLEKAREFSLN